jgi:hypothetical protein
MVTIKKLSEDEYKNHLKELKINQKQIEDIWTSVVESRKQEEYQNNKKKRKDGKTK